MGRITNNTLFPSILLLGFLFSSAYLIIFLYKFFKTPTTQHSIIRHLTNYCAYLLFSNAFYILNLFMYDSNYNNEFYTRLDVFLQSLVLVTMSTVRHVVSCSVKNLKIRIFMGDQNFINSLSSLDYRKFIIHRISEIAFSLCVTVLLKSLSERYHRYIFVFVLLSVHTNVIIFDYLYFIWHSLKIRTAWTAEWKQFINFSVYWRFNVMFFVIPFAECVIYWVLFGIVAERKVKDTQRFLDLVLSIIHISVGCLIGILFNKNLFNTSTQKTSTMNLKQSEEQAGWLSSNINAANPVSLGVNLKHIGLMTMEENITYELNPDISTEEQVDMLPYDEKWEFPREKLKLGTLLGCGAFGNVRKAEAIGIEDGTTTTIVAVKTVKLDIDPIYIRALVSELKIMIYLGEHSNVVNLLGACTTDLDKNEFAVIVEYCKHGNLRHFLLNHRNQFVDQIDGNGEIDHTIGLSSGGNSDPDTAEELIRTVDLINWCYQIAQGMAYLASKKVLHGDLAARNVLLSEGNIIKICDFGLAKNMYKYDNYKRTKNTMLPFKWMAIESIKDQVFSTQSDVWSFGITMWELFSLASAPYPGIQHLDHLYEKLTSGYRMEKPSFATHEMYGIMRNCWDCNPTSRPTFPQLINSIGGMLKGDTHS